MTGADFHYLLATAQVESNLNPNAQASTSSARGLFQFIEQTWLATLKEQGRRWATAPMPMPSRGSRRGRLRGGRSADARRDHESAIGPDRQCADGGRLHQGQRGKLADAARPRRRPRANSTSRISSAPPARARLIGACRYQPDRRRPPQFSRPRPAPIRRSSTTARQRPQRRRGLSRAGRPLRVARARRRRRWRPRRCARTAGETAAGRRAFAPDTAGVTETYAAAARLSPAAQVTDIAAGVPRPVPEPRRGAGRAAGQFALDVAAARRSGAVRAACTGRHGCEPAAPAARRRLSLFQDSCPTRGRCFAAGSERV